MTDHTAQRRQRNYSLSRRRLLGTTGGLGISTFLLGACSTASQKAQTGSSPAAAPAGQGQPRPGGTLNTFVAKNPATLDPQKSKDFIARAPAGHVMSRLFRSKTGPDPTVALSGEHESDLASGGESPDGVTWTIKLRPGTKFHDTPPVNGHQVQAEDVRTSFVRAMTGADSAAASYLQMIDQIEAPADDTVVFKLKYAYGPFLNVLAQAVAGWIYPREAASGAYDPAKTVIGSGPFLLDSYTPDVAIAYKKNPAWFEAGRPYIDAERCAIVPDAAQQLAQFTSGKLDELATDQNNLDTTKRANPKAAVVTVPFQPAYQAYGHLDDPASPFRDIRVRRAISLAIDREAIGKAIFAGHYHNNGVLPASKGKWAVPPDQLGASSQYFHYDLDMAKRLVSESGAADRIHRLAYPSRTYGLQFDTLAQMVASMLNAAGFKIQPYAADYNTEWINVGKGILYGHYDLDTLAVQIWQIGTQQADEACINALLPTGSDNHPKVNDPDLAAMVIKMRGMSDEAQRLKAVQDIQQYVANQMYFIAGIPTGDQYTLVQPRLSNYSYSSGVDIAGVETYSKLWLNQ